MQTVDGAAKRYGTRPSVLLGVRDEYQAYCVDIAAMLAGYELERKIREDTEQHVNEEPTIGPRGIRGKIPFIGKQD